MSICAYFPGVMSYVSILKQQAAAAAGGALQAMMFICGGVVRFGRGGGWWGVGGGSVGAPSRTRPFCKCGHTDAMPNARPPPPVISAHPPPPLSLPARPQFIQITPLGMAALGTGGWISLLVGICLAGAIFSAVLTYQALRLVVNDSSFTVASLLFLALTVPLTRYTDRIMAKDRTRRLAGIPDTGGIT